MLESNVEEPVVKYAKSKGMVIFKLDFATNAGWPDRLFLTKDGAHFFIEFKRPGKTLRKLQNHRKNTLLNMGHPAYGPVDTVMEGRRVVNLYTS